MLVLSRELGESVVIEDVRLTVLRIDSAYAEVSLAKVAGGKPVVLTLPRHEYVQACYDVRIVFIQVNGPKVRLGFDAPREVHISRSEYWDASRFRE